MMKVADLSKYYLCTLLIILSFSITAPVQAQHRNDHKHPPAKAVKDTVPRVKVAPPVTKDSVKPMDHGHDHDHAPLPAPTPKAAAPVTQGAHDHNAQGDHEHEQHGMSHAFSRNLPMTRNGSGTSWLPDNSPMYGQMIHTAGWMFMLHGQAYLRYNKQDLLERGSRGGEKLDAPNMVMLMGQRNIGSKGLFHFNTMLSLDLLTVGGEGYPLLFQTGESFRGLPLVDRQHPHDLFSELSVSYAHAISSRSDIYLYLGYPGEPALGPSAYVHRPSGFFNPDAPLTHHWVDATHISFGVATLGYRSGNFKLEASSFTGREPDEQRYDFDRPRFDSYSGRLSFNPSPSWAMQVSHGFIREPETFHPGEDVNRSTASVTYSRRGFGERFTNFTALWGMNKTAGHEGEHGVLLEGTGNINRTNIYGRYEWVQKSRDELSLDEAVFGHDALFPVNAITMGVSYDLLTSAKARLALGTQFSLYAADRRLSQLYGDTPLAGQVYLRLYPPAMGQREGRFFIPY